jgi:FkbM family methyltransferase
MDQKESKIMKKNYRISGPYYSQFGEDKWIVDNLSCPAQGTFVDIGASDGILGSNTYHFEKKGWRGLCVDADPRHYGSLKINRKIVETCAVSTIQGKVEFGVHNSEPTWSGLNCRGEHYTRIIVDSKRLRDLLAIHKITKIDILNIDVEGSEIDVWNSFDPCIHQPEVLIIEYADKRPHGSKDHIYNAIAKFPYTLVHTTPANLIFSKVPLGWRERVKRRGIYGSRRDSYYLTKGKKERFDSEK